MSADNEKLQTESQRPIVVAVVEECFNYAAWQNSVPLLRSVVVDNPTDRVLSSVTVEMKVDPAFARPKSWKVDRIGAGQKIELREIDIEVDAGYLERLDEAVRGILSFRVESADETLAESNVPLRILACDEWGGMGAMGQLLPAFVTPNDPALAPLLKSAAEALGRHGHSSGLDGYQTGDPNRAYMMSAALWSAVAVKSLTYATPPSSFEQIGQKTRRVSTVLNDGLATCLDTTLLFASGLEAMGLNPMLVMTSGHCFAGVWLIQKTLKKLVEYDCSELRKAIAAKELVVFETTLITHHPARTFADAVSAAELALAESREHEFVAAVDVARARMSQVRPLASHGERTAAQEDVLEPVPPALPEAPNYQRPAVVDEEPKPQTSAGRIDRWQRKLLDLSLRNRLLNFRPNKQSVPILCPDISQLEDRLADGARMRLVSLRDENTVAERDADLHQQRTQKDLDFEFAREALARDEVACPLDARDLDARLTALLRKVKNDLAEGGSNTLYLAVGFLRWKQSGATEKSYRAPLLLVPVKLLRRSVTSPFYLAHHEDDVRFNATLLQLLKKDFGCDLTSMESDLPTDDSGVDVPRVLERMRRAVRDIPGFEVVEDVAVAPFSFAKYLMWKDLVERVDQLGRNRVVHHLVNEPDKAFSSENVGPMPRPHEIDTRYMPEDLVHPLPADSSQLTAVMAAAEGHDLVIVGPPGTGKSQTIANVIAQCLAVRKTVLFVAEKTAALDVVHRRLREHGLGDCCVELHSNKAERRRLLDQLEASWNRRTRPDNGEWIDISNRLRVRRDELNTYVSAIHTPHPNGWTIYRAMGLSVRERDTTSPELNWPQTTAHDKAAYDTLKKSIDELAFASSALPKGANLGRLEASEWSMAWETKLLASYGQLKDAANLLTTNIGRLASALHVPLPADITASQLTALYRVSHEVSRTELPPESLILHGQLDVLKAGLNSRRALLEQRDRASEALSAALSSFAAALGGQARDGIPHEERTCYYRLANELMKGSPPPAALIFHPAFDTLPERLAQRSKLLRQKDEAWQAAEARGFNSTLIKRLSLTDLESAWSAAVGAFWPLSVLRKRSVRRELKSCMKTEAIAAPDVDLPLLREHQDLHDSLAENSATLALPDELQSVVEQVPDSLTPWMEPTRRMREAIEFTGNTLETVGAATRNSLESLVAAAKLLYPPARELERLKAELRDNLAQLGLPPDLSREVDENTYALDARIESATRLRQSLSSLGIPANAVGGLTRTHDQNMQKVADGCCRSARMFQNAWLECTKLAGDAPAAMDSSTVIGDAAAQAENVLTNRILLKQWTAWVAARKQAEVLGLAPFVTALQQGELPPNEVPYRFEIAYARWWLPSAVDSSDTLRAFQRIRHEDAVEDFRTLDELARKAAAPRAMQAIYHDLPPADQVPRKSELGLLRHQMGLKRPSKSIREVIAGMPQEFGKLAPCLLMSPLSIAQYLPADHAQFDVVVFDEASQIPTWDAIGAIARGRQTIIVGDPKQLPPTNFFGRADSDEDNDELDDYEKDLESILDEAQASGLPTLQLNWHYRSRHESLIAFSNYNYYGNQLVTFPAAESEDRGVSLTLVDGSLYDRGKSRTNRGEAEAIVADAVSRMCRCLAKPECDRLTYGVVTFNSQQQSLIQDLFDQALRDAPELEWFFADERIEPTAVKNLENVQGDERDVIYFSITFGKDAAGKFPVDFGAINRVGGERRLNVAVTRARQTLLVYASFLPDELRAERSSARGVHDLKAFLHYSHKGPSAIAERTDGSVGDMESPFEEAVADAMKKRGWRLDPQVGVSGFRVDLGVIHPDRPGAYLAGIECDGATYHRSAAARDRDKTRQQVLEHLGWKIIRVWSPDWWYDPETAVENLHSQLSAHLEAFRQKEDDMRAAEPPVLTGDRTPGGSWPVAEECDSSLHQRADFSPTIQPNESNEELRPLLVAKNTTGETPRLKYQFANLVDATERQASFFDDDYSQNLRQMALAVVEAEAPVRDDVVARRVARAHGFVRTSARIKERVLSLLPEITTTEDDAGRFFWATTEPATTVPFRHATSEDERRSLDETPMQELRGLILSRPDLAASEDPALSFAREIGLARLAKSARERLEAALELAAGDDA